MPIANPLQVCYRKQQALKGHPVFNRGNCLGHGCHGYSKGPDSLFPCPEFVSAVEVLNGLCVYQLHARKGLEILHHSHPELCETCYSDHNSGKGCHFYTSVRDYLQGVCALKIRAERLLDKNGDKESLSKGELYCLEVCQGTIKINCEGYVPVHHVINQVCGNKSKVLIKLARGNELQETLEQICAGCTGCEVGKVCYDSVANRSDFDILTGLHTQGSNPSLAV